jgi:hypothetical protein
MKMFEISVAKILMFMQRSKFRGIVCIIGGDALYIYPDNMDPIMPLVLLFLGVSFMISDENDDDSLKI